MLTSASAIATRVHVALLSKRARQSSRTFTQEAKKDGTAEPYQLPPKECYGPTVRLRPTLRASHLFVAGVLGTGAGIALTHPAMVAYGAALLSGIALSRALTRVSVARARAAGFEMLWTTSDSVERAVVGQ